MFTPRYSAILSSYFVQQDRFASYNKLERSAAELIRLCASQGAFQGVEITSGDEPYSLNHRNKREIRALLSDNALDLTAIAPNIWSPAFRFGSLGSTDPKVRQQAIDLIREAIDLAAELGAGLVNIWPGQDGWDYYLEVDYARLYSAWVEGVRLLADHNPQVRLGLEPKPYEPRAFSLLDTGARALMLIKDIERPNVGLTFDVGHALFVHENLAETVALAQRDSRLLHIHLNDNYGDWDWDLSFGSVHLQAFIEMVYWLMRTSYQGFLSMDIFANRTDPAETMLESQRWIEAIINLVDRAGIGAFDQLLEVGDGLNSQRFLRELIFGD